MAFDILVVDDIDKAQRAIRVPDAGDVVNWRADNTRRLQRSLVSGAGVHLVIGDSTSDSYVGSGDPGGATQHAAMWPRLMRQKLNAAGIPIAGTGWVPTAGASALAIDPRWVKTSGTWTQAGYGYVSSSSSGATLTFTSDLPGTSVAVAYSTSSGPFTVTIDGVETAVTPSGGPAAVEVETLTGLSDVCQTVTITRTSGTVILFAANVFRGSGLTIHNLAQVGISAQLWAAQTANSRGWVTTGLDLDPDVVHIALGVNDINYSRTPAQAAADVESVAGLYPGADVVLYGQYAPSPDADVDTPPSDGTWATYIGLLRGLAVELDCPLIDLYRRSGGYEDADDNGLMGDLIHPNAVAQADWANLITHQILRG